MKVEFTHGAFGLVLWAVLSLPASAQSAAQQMPAAASPASPMSVSSCAQSSQGVSRSIDILTGRIDEARQTNDAAKMRAAVADLQVALAQMKTELADCTSLTQAASGSMGNMPGMAQSKMQMPPGTPVMQPGSNVPAADAKTAAPMAGMDHTKMPMAPKSTVASGRGAPASPAKPAAPAEMDHSKMAGAAAAKGSAPVPSKMVGMDHSKMAGEKAAPAAAETPPKAGQASAVVFTVRTDPAPPRSGKNDFEVTVKDTDGKPIADAEVSLAFNMPSMPSMNIPVVKLTSAGNGAYKASGTIGMTGDWDVTVTASRNGQQLGTKKIRLTAK